MTGPSPSGELWHRNRDEAVQYERWAVPYLIGPWVAELVESVMPREGERVRDIACGSGHVTRVAARYVGSLGMVTGLDVNPEMLAVAKTVPYPVGVSIRWEEGDAGSLPFSDATFDVVFCNEGLQYFPDQPKALREMHRVLAPGGRVAAAVWSRIERSPYFLALVRAVERHVGQEAANQMRSSFSLGDGSDLIALVREAGFDRVEVRVVTRTLRLPPPEDFIPNQCAGSSLAALVAALDPKARGRLISDVSAELQSYSDKDGLASPFTINLLVAHSAP